MSDKTAPPLDREGPGRIAHHVKDPLALLRAIADADPRMDGNTGDCWACGAGLDDEDHAYGKPHHPGCAWLLVREALRPLAEQPPPLVKEDP